MARRGAQGDGGVNLRDLQYLVALADHGHFGRAAVASYVSQPTLSTQLKKLERHLTTSTPSPGGLPIRRPPPCGSACSPPWRPTCCPTSSP
jgi:hypothetical protein